MPAAATPIRPLLVARLITLLLLPLPLVADVIIAEGKSTIAIAAANEIRIIDLT